MNAISSVSPIGFRNAEHEISEILNLQDGKVSSQKYNESLRQMNPSANKIIRQFCESTDVRLDFEIDNKKNCVLVKVINNVSGKVIREIPLKPQDQMDRVTGVHIEIIV